MHISDTTRLKQIYPAEKIAMKISVFTTNNDNTDSISNEFTEYMSDAAYKVTNRLDTVFISNLLQLNSMHVI